MNNAQARFETLKASGADMSKYFVFDNKLMRANGNALEIVEDDPILESIIEDGYVRNTQLHRRWVLAQMWEMLNYKGYQGNGYDAALRSHGYMYQWKVLLEEIRVLGKIDRADKETFNQRSHFFDKSVVDACVTDYMNKIVEKAKSLPTRNCKGVPYIRIAGRDIFVSDIDKKLAAPMRSDYYDLTYCESYTGLYYKLRRFIQKYVKVYKLDFDTKMTSEFVQAFKGAGAYYSLRNLVQFHNCSIFADEGIYSGTSAVSYLDSKLNDYKWDGWRYLAMLKKCIADNSWTPNWR